MAVWSIWDARYTPDRATEGRTVTEAIWRDMEGYAGYLRHVIVEDLDDPGHLIVLSEWDSREDADRVREEYADNANARRADSLVAQPRQRTVGRALSTRPR